MRALTRLRLRDAAGQNYRFSSIVLGVVNSTPFQKRIKTSEDADEGSSR